ncbi:MAG: radical SAM protein [Thermaerobacterales bacterium]
MGFAVGVGLTNDCNFACPHCYRDAHDIRHLSLEDLQRIFKSIPVDSVNLGTGENGTHPDYLRLAYWLVEQDCKVTVTSNSLTVDMMPDDLLRRFAGVEYSLDFPDARRHDQFRGEGNFEAIFQSLARTRELDVPASITACMMNVNHDCLVDIGRLAFAHDALFRVNVFQSSTTDFFYLGYDQYWGGFERLLREFALVTTTEPVLAAALGLDDFEGCGCGRVTVRVSPKGTVIPCVYWPDDSMTLDDLEEMGEGVVEAPSFRAAREAPAECRGCDFEPTCAGGCSARRLLEGSLDNADPYCRLLRQDPFDVPLRRAQGPDMPKARSACTTIFAP